MKKAIRMHSTGGPEVLQWEDVPVPDPGPGEVLLRQHAVGLNYIDVYFRTGLYKLPSLPAVIGQEGAGVVVAVGPDVTNGSPTRAVSAPMRSIAWRTPTNSSFSRNTSASNRQRRSCCKA
jgi:NADPH:quinone reductase-like Zn-dependent oxidoreductase